MAFWGAPIDLEDHALLACQAALRCRREIEKLSARWKADGRYEFETRIGLSTGEIIVGNIGSDQRMNYSVIGDTVKLASRSTRSTKPRSFSAGLPTKAAANTSKPGARVVP